MNEYRETNEGRTQQAKPGSKLCAAMKKYADGAKTEPEHANAGPSKNSPSDPQDQYPISSLKRIIAVSL